MRTLMAICLVAAVATEAAPLVRSLRWWLDRVAHTQPYELRLQLNDWLLDGTLAARAVTAALPGDAPVLVDNRGGPDWFLALRLQPRRVYFDRLRVRQRLAAAGTPFVVVHLDRADGATRWWFESRDGAGHLRRTAGASPAIRLESFEHGLVGWTAVSVRDREP